MTLQEKILFYMAKNNLTQQDLASTLGIARPYLSRILNGCKPSKKLKLRIEIIIGE